MGYCISFSAVPSQLPRVDRETLRGETHEDIGFGRHAPVALRQLLAPPDPPSGGRLFWGSVVIDAFHERQKAPAASRPEPRLLASTIWGGPPAELVGDVARIRAADVRAIAAALTAWDEAALRAAFERERELLATLPMSEGEILRDFAQLRGFYATAAAAERDVVVRWEYR